MSMIEEAISKAKEVRTRVLTTLDQFRPKLLVKKPLSEIKIFGEENLLEGQGIGTIISRVRERIEGIRTSIGVLGGELGEAEGKSATIEPQVTKIEGKKGGKVAIHY